MVFEHAKRQKKVHTPPCTGDDRYLLLLHKCLEYLHSLPGQQIAGYVSLIEDQIPSREIEDIRIIEPVILIQCAGLQFILRDQKDRPVLPRKSRGQVRLLGIQTSGDLDNAPVLFQLLLQVLVSGDSLQRLRQCFQHAVISFFVYPL